MIQKYYKVMRGWGDDYVSVSEDKLHLAIYAKLAGKVFLADGLIDGPKIEMIVPDYHKTMGWNQGYKMQPEDYGDVKSRVGDMQKRIGIASDIVKDEIHLNQGRGLDSLRISDEISKRLKNPEGSLTSGVADVLQIK